MWTALLASDSFRENNYNYKLDTRNSNIPKYLLLLANIWSPLYKSY